MEKALIFLTSDILFYDLLSLNIKITDKLLCRGILDEDIGPLYYELEWTLTYLLQNYDIDFSRNGKEFQRHKGTSVWTLWKKPLGRKWNLFVLYLAFLRLFLP